MDGATALAQKLAGSDSNISFDAAVGILRSFYLKDATGRLVFEFTKGECRYIDPTLRITPQNINSRV